MTGTPPHGAMVLQAARLALPLWLAGDPARARAAGAETRDGVRYEVLAVDLGGGMELRADVDPRTGRVVRTVGVMEGPGGGRLEFVNLYSDFRAVKGILFAFREENFAGGQRTGETVLELVEPLAEALPGAFDPAPTIRL